MYSTIIDNFITEYDTFVSEFSKKAQEKLKEVILLFWNENPGVKVITWTQYAPYFNDGEPCEFGVNDITYSNAVDYDDIRALSCGDYDGDTPGIWAVSSWNTESSIKKVGATGADPESIKKFSGFIESEAMENVLKTVLGEDVRVVITRNGIACEDYSGNHD